MSEIAKVLLIDLAALFFRAWYGSAKQPVNHALDVVRGQLHQLAQTYPYSAVAVDSPPYDRSKLLPEYKANRPAQDEAARLQFKQLVEHMRSEGYLVWRHQGCEADDVIATAVKLALEFPNVEVVIASSDKDLMQLVGERVRLLTLDGRIVGPEEVRAKWGVPPSQIRDLLALMGDASDNVPGVKGIGPKTAVKMLEQYGSVASLRERAAEVQGAIGEALRLSMQGSPDPLSIAYRLIGLRDDVPIVDFASVFEPRESRRAAQTPAPEPAYDDESYEEEERAAFLEETSAPNAAAIPPPPPSPPPTSAPREVAAAPAAPEQKTAAPAPSAPAKARPDAALVAEERALVVPGSRSAAPVLVDPSDPAWALALQPSTAQAAWIMASKLHASRLYERKFGSVEAIWTVILLGREHGLSALAALQSMTMVEGKVEMDAALIVAKVQRSGLARYFTLIESTDERATWETHRVGEAKSLKMSFSVAEAERRGVFRVENGKRLTGNGKLSNWHRMPDVMCMWRAATKLARAKYADVVRGLYGQGEIREMNAARVIDVDFEEGAA